jgi:multiple sugar transport system permease protein
MSSARQEALWLISPGVVLVAAVTALPMLVVLCLSFEARGVFHPPTFVGFDNYVRLAVDPRFWNALRNTLYFTLVSVALELALGVAIAMLVARAGRARGLIYGAILVPWAIPTVASARIWEWMYNAEFGVLNHLLGAQLNWLGDPLWALNAAVAMDVWKSTPFVALLLLAGLQGIPRDLYRAAAIDGAGVWTTFWRITLPLLAPVILVAVVFRTIDALRVFDAVYVLTGGGPANGTETLSIYAYKILFQTLDFGYGSTLAVAVLLVTAAATALYAWLLRAGVQ